MAQHPADDWLTTTTKWPGFNNDPLRVLRWHVVFEPADLLLLGVHQPADTVLRCMAINKWIVLVWHDATLAKSAALHGTKLLLETES